MSISDSKWVKALLASVALVVLGTLVLRFVGPKSHPITVVPSAGPVAQSDAADSTRTVSQMPWPTPEESEEAETDAEDLPRIPREKVEEFLQLRNRSAASLLAGFHSLKDTNLLYEAAAKFPNDPQVQWTMLAQPLNPEERREWLNRFKESSPENSLANYLSAAEHFKSGQVDAALKELLAAGGKPQFKVCAMAAMLEERELRRFVGQDSAAAWRAVGWADELLSNIQSLKLVAKGITTAQAGYVQAGDRTSAMNLTQHGLRLATRLSSGDAGKLAVNHQVGIAIEAMALNNLEPVTPYEFLGGKTPNERREELKQMKADSRSLNAIVASLYGTLSESERQSYSGHIETYGEIEAVKWLQQVAADRAVPGK